MDQLKPLFCLKQGSQCDVCDTVAEPRLSAPSATLRPGQFAGHDAFLLRVFLVFIFYFFIL